VVMGLRNVTAMIIVQSPAARRSRCSAALMRNVRPPSRHSVQVGDAYTR
jgi:hypothetical protein